MSDCPFRATIEIFLIFWWRCSSSGATLTSSWPTLTNLQIDQGGDLYLYVHIHTLSGRSSTPPTSRRAPTRARGRLKTWRPSGPALWVEDLWWPLRAGPQKSMERCHFDGVLGCLRGLLGQLMGKVKASGGHGGGLSALHEDCSQKGGDRDVDLHWGHCPTVEGIL